ncbi:DNA polymerase IV [bacterium]|nr:MAG: DNA polymerase IV [bacterium]
MDAFYASVEVLDDPSLAGRPVIVGGTPEGRGVVAAASYEARGFGVHSAMSAARARRLCPDGVFLRGRMERYHEISAGIGAIFRDFTPLVEPLSIDEAFLDVGGCLRLFGDGETIGRLIKDRIGDEVGLIASVGVAPNKFLAKLASDLEKPDGFVVIGSHEIQQRLDPLPVNRIWGVGRVFAGELNRLGINTIADLRNFRRQDLVNRWGDHARHILALAEGRDERPVVPDHAAKSIGNETTFRHDIAAADLLQEILDALVDKVAHRLRSQGLVARTVTLKARFADFSTPTRSETLTEPTDQTVLLREVGHRLLTERLDRGQRPLRLLGFTVSQLELAGAGQGELFVDQDRHRQQTLDRLVDSVHHRFGAKLGRGLRRSGEEPESD